MTKTELEILEIEKQLALPNSELKVSRQSLWTRLMELNDQLAEEIK